LNDITGNDFEESDREDDEEETGDGTGEEFIAFLYLFGIVASRHDLNGSGQHDD